MFYGGGVGYKIKMWVMLLKVALYPGSGSGRRMFPFLPRWRRYLYVLRGVKTVPITSERYFTACMCINVIISLKTRGGQLPPPAGAPSGSYGHASVCKTKTTCTKPTSAIRPQLHFV